MRDNGHKNGKQLVPESSTGEPADKPSVPEDTKPAEDAENTAPNNTGDEDPEQDTEGIGQGNSEFERIKRRSDEFGEYWSARDLARVLGYTDYRNFVRVIRKAELACQNSGQEVGDHFVSTNEMVEI